MSDFWGIHHHGGHSPSLRCTSAAKHITYCSKVWPVQGSLLQLPCQPCATTDLSSLSCRSSSSVLPVMFLLALGDEIDIRLRDPQFTSGVAAFAVAHVFLVCETRAGVDLLAYQPALGRIFCRPAHVHDIYSHRP